MAELTPASAPTATAPAATRDRAAAPARRVLAFLERIPPVGWVAILSLVLIAVYGTGYVGYDSSFTLVWAKSILHGHLPEYSLPQAPTPHPLTTIYCIVLSLFGGTTPLRLAGVLGLVYFAVLGVVCYEFGRRLFSRPVGIAFALIVLTRPRFVEQAQNASVEIPWLAMVIGAAAMEARTPKRGLPVLGLLGLAGLLRPETWLLTAAYTIYLCLGAGLRDRVKYVAVALIAPVVWLLFDLILARDALFSLTHTQDVGEKTQTAAGGLGAVTGAISALGGILHPAIVAGAAVGLVYVLWVSPRKAILPLAIAALGSVSFFAIGLSGLPTLSRFFFLPSLVLALFCAVVIGAWRPPAGAGRRGRAEIKRPVEVAVWAVMTLAAIGSLPLEVSKLNAANAYAAMSKRAQIDLHTLMQSPTARAAIDRCPPIGLHTFRVRPFIDLWHGKPYPPLEDQNIVATKRGLLLERPADRRKFPVPPSFRTVYRNGTWTLYERC